MRSGKTLDESRRDVPDGEGALVIHCKRPRCSVGGECEVGSYDCESFHDWAGSGGLRCGSDHEEREVVALFPSDPIAFLTVELSAYHR